MGDVAPGLASPGVGEPLTAEWGPARRQEVPLRDSEPMLDLQLIWVLTHSTFFLGEVWAAEPRKSVLRGSWGPLPGAADAKQQTPESGLLSVCGPSHRRSSERSS